MHGCDGPGRRVKDHGPEFDTCERPRAEGEESVQKTTPGSDKSINNHSKEAKRLLRNGDTGCIGGSAEPQGLTHLPCQPSRRMTSSGGVLFMQHGAGLRRVEMHMESPRITVQERDLPQHECDCLHR